MQENAAQKYLDSTTLSTLESQLLEVMVDPHPKLVEFAKANLWPAYLTMCDKLDVPIRADFVQFWDPGYTLSIKQRRVKIIDAMAKHQKQLDDLVKECASVGHKYVVVDRYRGHDGYGETDDYWETAICTECKHIDSRKQ